VARTVRYKRLTETARGERFVTSVDNKPRRAVLKHHPRSRHASREGLQKLAGVFRLSGPMPSPKFLEEQVSDQVGEQPRSTRAGD
jgi:hypothetical protein